MNSAALRVGGITAAALALTAGVGLQPASAAPAAAPTHPAVDVSRGPLVDLGTAPDPFDHASAIAVAARHVTGSTFVLAIYGIDRAAAGRSFGAHLHTGPCVAGAPLAAGPHYNVSGVTPPVANPTTEVWLDFTVSAAGTAVSSATVPFVPSNGQRSIVIHAEPTSPTGAAGARLACLPLPLD